MKLGSSIHSGSSTSSSLERDPGTKRESAFGRLRCKLSLRKSSSSSSTDRGAPPAVENDPAGVDCRKSGELRRVFDYFDENGDGMLGFEEFERLMESGGEEERRKDLEEAFGMYEMEGSGCITVSSLKRTLGRLGEARSMEDCKTMIWAFDLNGDGADEVRNMADQTITPQRDDEQPSRQQQQQESFGSTKRFHIIFTLFKLLVITHSNSQPIEALSRLILQLYIICEAIYLIALIQVTGPTNPNPIYKYLYIIFGTLGAELLLWTSISLAMWLILNMCLFVFVLASAGLLTQVSNQLLEIVQSSNDVPSDDVPPIEV